MRGRLQRIDGSPVAGERVHLISGLQGQHGFDFRWPGLAFAVSGADGSFRMQSTSGPEFEPTVLRLGWRDWERGEDDAIRIEVPDVVHATGRVVAADGGTPIGGARLVFSGDVVARTNSDGRYDFTWTPPFAEKLRVELDGWLPATLEAGVELIALRRARTIEGTVRLADGAPAAGLEVVGRPAHAADDESRWFLVGAATDSDGRFVLQGLDEGTSVVTASDPRRHRLISARKSAVVGGERVALDVVRGARLDVDVVDDKGDRMYGARITARPQSDGPVDETIRTRFDRDVAFALALEVPYTIRVEHKEFEPVEIPNVRGGGEPLRIVLAPKRPR